MMNHFDEYQSRWMVAKRIKQAVCPENGENDFD
jgi:hypothetical protein